MEDLNVTQNRHKYVGGSDLPILMKGKYFENTDLDLVKIKAGLKEKNFVSNVYVDYGNAMEDKIRNWFETKEGKKFDVETVIDENLHIRGNLDGFNKENKHVLEIKTTSDKDLNKKLVVYNYQIQMYMYLTKSKNGTIVIYKRPKDFDENFNEENIEIHKVKYDKQLVETMLNKISNFWKAVERVKSDPFVTDQELQNILIGSNDFNLTEQEKLISKLESAENNISRLKKEIEKFEEEKTKAYEVFIKNDIKSFETDNYKFTVVLPSETTSDKLTALKDLDETTIKYLKKKKYINKVTNNRNGHLKITKKKKEGKRYE